MKIGINTTGFISGVIGGSENYLRNLVDALQKVDHENSYLLLCDGRNASEFPLFNASFGVKIVNFTKPSPGWFVRNIARSAFRFDILRPVMNRLDLDVIHHPFSVLDPIGLKIPSVLTFLDMQHEFFPEFFSRLELRFRRAFSRASAEQATRVIAISNYVKESLVARYELDPDKIDVIYLGYGSDFRVIDDAGRLAAVKSRYGLDLPFLYYPAATWPHKNHKALLAALKLLIERSGFDGRLVLTGTSKQSHADILGEIGRLGLAGRVKVLGHIPADELPCLYNLARLLVFPSLFEGFGIPLVEAMACGCPIVCSNVTSMPEVAGDAAEMFNPGSPEDMAEKIWSAWSDKALRERMKEKGFRRLHLFDWDEMARRTVDVYRKAGEAGS